MIETLGIDVYLDSNYDDAITAVSTELQKEGFGVLTEIDVKATMKKKLDVEYRPYKILGACNPSLAHKALTAAPQVGLLLPCNVTVSEETDGRIHINIIDPLQMMGVIEHPELTAVAREAEERLRRVAAALTTI